MNSIVHSLFLELRERNGHQGYMFLNSRDEPIKFLRTAFNTARRKAGLLELRFHDLRYTAATRMAFTGRLDVVRKILGHSVINITMRYVHPNEDERAVVETLTTKCPEFVPIGFRDNLLNEADNTKVAVNIEEIGTKPT